jgi:hypothetical protein
MKRLINSHAGNPRRQYTLTDGRVLVNATDASVSYDMDNFGPDHRANAGRPIRFTLDHHGRITGMDWEV